MQLMRTHSDIIESAGGYKKLAKAIGLPAERTRFWVLRSSIPADQWKALSEAKIATLDELATAALARRSKADA